MNSAIAPHPNSPSAAEANAVYLRNMAHLWRFDPALARRIEAVPDDARVPIEPARSGGVTAALADPQGRPAYLHSRYDPVAEAEKLIDGVETEDSYCFIVGGFGLGYHLLALRRRVSAEAIIVVAEPNLHLLAAALASVDLGELLADGRLLILTEAHKATLHERLQPHMTLVMLGTKFVTHPPSQRLIGDFFREFRALVTEFVAYSRMSLMTLVANSKITCKNIANNIAAYACTPPIDVLRERFAGVPAIVVSAGPSLRKNIDQLVDAQDRAVICAVQTTLKPLLERGIRPHFVTSLDYHAVSEQYFEGLTGLERVHLVAEPKATWHVIDRYPGPISLLDNAFAHLLIGDKLGARAGLPAGATVAHLAFYLARYMGCDPIIFIGQDLAYTGYVYYAPGVEIHRTWRSEINRFNTLETKEWERTARARPVLRKTVDNAGRPVFTDELLLTYLEQFERDIAQTQARVVNATEGGARIRGTEVMDLAEARARYCAKSLEPERFAYLRDVPWRDTSRLALVRDEMSARVDEVGGLIEVCTELIDLLGQLQGLTHSPSAFNRVLVRVDELRAQVHTARRAYRVINAAAQLAELRRFRADRKLAGDGAEGVARAKRQLERDVPFVTSVRDAGREMRDLLAEACARVEAALAAASADLSVARCTS